MQMCAYVGVVCASMVMCRCGYVQMQLCADVVMCRCGYVQVCVDWCAGEGVWFTHMRMQY